MYLLLKLSSTPYLIAILSLLYRQSSYNQIILSKITFLFLYIVATYLTSLIFSVVLKISLFISFSITNNIWKSWFLINLNRFLPLNFCDQLQDGRLQHLTNLTLPQLSIGYVFYIFLFMTLTFYAFRKRVV